MSDTVQSLNEAGLYLGTLSPTANVDRITLNWSPACELVWTHGKKLLQYIDSRDEFYESFDDISVTMRSRAQEGYGLTHDKLWQMFPEGSTLHTIWKWVDRAKNIDTISLNSHASSISSREELFGISASEKLMGVRHIITRQGLTASGSESCIINTRSEKIPPCNAPDAPAMNALKAIYKSDDRKRALLLCGWDSNIECPTTSTFIESIEAEGKWSRAAAAAIFYQRIRRAIQSLEKGAEASKERGGDPHLRYAAMALSGYTSDRSTLWRESCQSLKANLSDSYLKAIFTFLITDNENYSEILKDDNIALNDRVAFANIFLSDAALCDYINSLVRKLTKHGDLKGILLTGLTSDSLDLFLKFVERTSDVQTISLLILHSLPSSLCNNSNAKLWVESYRNLLDCWKLWQLRAQFDIEWHKALNFQEGPPQVIFVSCNFCGHPISSYISAHENRSHMSSVPHVQSQNSHFNRQHSSAAGSKNSTRIQSCRGCRKPLPRCAMCLMQLGTPAGMYWRHGYLNSFTDKDTKISPISSWFTWCQTCRHGGHSSHMIDWFKSHPDCPVAGCTCKCMSLDAAIRI